MAAVRGQALPGRVHASKFAGSHLVHGCHPIPVRRMRMAANHPCDVEAIP